jgi:hypothetical protein
MKQYDRDDPREMARLLLEWLSSAQGQKSVEESDGRVAETAALLEKGRDIDPAKLHEPFTV